LVLYTDGVTGARNEQGEFFDEDRLIAYASAHLGHPAHDVRDAILGAGHEFVGTGIQRDDIALTIVVRDAL
jgi:serine phosphatase RsbU (regulator of sigma subunit)